MASKKVSLKCSVAEQLLFVDQDTCTSQFTDVLDLPSFVAPGDEDLTWVVSLKPGEFLREESTQSWVANRISLRLHFKSVLGKTSVFARRYIKVTQTTSDENIDRVIQSFTCLTESDFYIFKNIVFEDITDSYDIGDMIFCNTAGNELKIYVKIHISDQKLDVVTSLPSSSVRVVECPLESSLSSCLAELLKSQQFSDLTLVVDVKEFPVHRNILSARSSVFKAMLSSQCTESLSGRVVIQDIHPNVVERMLRYVRP